MRQSYCMLLEFWIRALSFIPFRAISGESQYPFPQLRSLPSRGYNPEVTELWFNLSYIPTAYQQRSLYFNFSLILCGIEIFVCIQRE